MAELNNICDGFSSLSVCALSLNNLMQIKVIMLGVIALFSIYFLYHSKNMNVDNTLDFYKRGCYKYLSLIYLAFTPFWVLLLRANISFEIFLTIIIGLYLVLLTLGIGGVLLSGVKKGNDLVTDSDTMTVTERFKYRGSRNG